MSFSLIYAAVHGAHRRRILSLSRGARIFLCLLYGGFLATFCILQVLLFWNFLGSKMTHWCILEGIYYMARRVGKCSLASRSWRAIPGHGDFRRNTPSQEPKAWRQTTQSFDFVRPFVFLSIMGPSVTPWSIFEWINCLDLKIVENSKPCAYVSLFWNCCFHWNINFIWCFALNIRTLWEILRRMMSLNNSLSFAFCMSSLVICL